MDRRGHSLAAGEFKVARASSYSSDISFHFRQHNVAAATPITTGIMGVQCVFIVSNHDSDDDGLQQIQSPCVTLMRPNFFRAAATMASEHFLLGDIGLECHAWAVLAGHCHSLFSGGEIAVRRHHRGYHSGRHESYDPTNYRSVSEASAAYCQHRSENRARKGPSPRISRRKNCG